MLFGLFGAKAVPTDGDSSITIDAPVVKLGDMSFTKTPAGIQKFNSFSSDITATQGTLEVDGHLIPAASKLGQAHLMVTKLTLDHGISTANAKLAVSKQFGVNFDKPSLDDFKPYQAEEEQPVDWTQAHDGYSAGQAPQSGAKVHTVGKEASINAGGLR